MGRSGLGANVEKLRVLKTFKFGSLFSALFLFRIIAGFRRGDNEQIYVFDEDFYGLVPQIHPVEGEGKLPQMAWAPIKNTLHAAYKMRTIDDVHR